MKIVVFDSDDFASTADRNCIEQLLFLKQKFPNFKITLFAIPHWQDKDQTNFFQAIIDLHGDWIQLGIHGWDHHSNFECSQWDYQTAKKYITKAYKTGVYQPLFKAPGWQISRDTYGVLKELGFICADHKESAYTEPGVPNSERRPKHLKVYEIDHPWMVHTHTWNCVGNGIPEMIETWEKNGYPWNQETEFLFITDLFKEKAP